MSSDMTFDQFRDEARRTLMQECCLDWPRLQAIHEASAGNGLVCVHLATRGRYNCMGVYKGTKKLFKHVFLQNHTFRNEVVKYYKGLGYDWVDVLPLNRVDWKIFLWYHPKPQSRSHSRPQSRSDVGRGEWPACDNQVAWRLGMGLEANDRLAEAKADDRLAGDRPGSPSSAIPGDVSNVDPVVGTAAPEAFSAAAASSPSDGDSV